MSKESEAIPPPALVVPTPVQPSAPAPPVSVLKEEAREKNFEPPAMTEQEKRLMEEQQRILDELQ